MASLSVFGPEAERIASRCEAELSLLFCDGTNVAEALAEATRRLRDGDTFLVAPLLQDPLSVVSRLAASSIYEQTADVDQRRYFFELLAAGTLEFNGKPVQQHEIYQTEVLQTLREISQLGDGLYVRSSVEQMRLESTFKRKRLYVAVAPLIDPSVPPARPQRGADHIVVWAPHEQAFRLATYSYALWYMKAPVIFVCRGEIPDTPHHFVGIEQAADVLAHAAVIVDTEISDPGTAIAFAGRGFGLATAVTSGAGEYLQGVATYEMNDFSSISSAVTRVRGDRRTCTRPMPDPGVIVPATIAAAQPVIPEDPPLVSIVVPTYNRPHELRGSLESFAKQTYPNFEILVVNDCGEDVADIVAEFPFARYLCTPRNNCCSATVNYGLHAARGIFVGALADDDRYYPNHIAALVAALLASGVDVAHSNVILRHETKLPDGSLATFGHRLDHDGDLDCFEVHWADTHMGAQTYLIRRDSYEKIGFLDEQLMATSDIDSTIKLSKLYDFTHVNLVTGEMGCRDDHSSVASKLGEGLATELHRVLKSHAPESHIIAVRIEALVGYIAAASRVGKTHDSPWVRLAEPIPVGERLMSETALSH